MVATDNERALVAREDLVPDFAISPEEAASRIRKLQQFVQGQMHDGSDFGVIPGTNKPTLLKPGAEKLCNLFGFAIEQEVTQRTERWEDPGFFYYEVKVGLRNKRTGHIEAEGFGSANSKESRYRYRWQGAECPSCGKAAIMRSKYPPRDRPDDEPGWYCNPKADGCGANIPFEAGNFERTRVENPDIYDQVNTLLKMAAKRALVDATLKAVRASDLFTQDLEDMGPIGHDPNADADPVQAPAEPPRGARQQSRPAPVQQGEPGPSQTRSDEKRNGVTLPPKVESLGTLYQAARFHFGMQPGDLAKEMGLATASEIPASVKENYGGSFGRVLEAVAEARRIASGEGATVAPSAEDGEFRVIDGEQPTAMPAPTEGDGIDPDDLPF